MVTPFARGALLTDQAPPVFVNLEAIAPSGNLFILTPHPDDETLGCGGAIAAACDAGRRVTVVALTDGAGSHPHSRSYPPERLVALRENELQTAVDRLTKGRGEVRFLRYPDQGAPHEEEAINALVPQLLDMLEQAEAGAFWTTWGGDPHPDHQSASRIASAVERAGIGIPLWRFPIWGRFTDQGLSRYEQIMRFDTQPYQRRKSAAIAAFRSQMTSLIDDDPDGFVMDVAAQKHFLETPEIFIRDAHGV